MTAGGDFPLENLPYGAFRAADGSAHLGVAIGDQILDLRKAAAAGLLDPLSPELRAACAAEVLNPLMALGPGSAHQLRERLTALLGAEGTAARFLIPQQGAEMLLPVVVGDYTDFYASCHHATHVGKLFRPTNPLLPNYKHVPIGYHGRSSSVVASPAPVRRPCGQRPAATPDGVPPDFGPTRQLDYEFEIAAVVGQGNALGEPIPLARAGEHIFGVLLLNDWSARDLQRWEYQPLGPFLAKNFATSVSPWVVTWEALAPFRVPRLERPEGDPAPLPYLDDPADQARGGVDIILEGFLSTRAMREQGLDPACVCRSRARDLYWTLGQMLTHHASNGCNLRPGDLLGSGTVSGADPLARGCLLELTSGGKEPLTLPTGETRKFLEDGDEVTLHAFCQGGDGLRIGWGACQGLILPAIR